jgi:hypothetical protein
MASNGIGPTKNRVNVHVRRLRRGWLSSSHVRSTRGPRLLTRSNGWNGQKQHPVGFRVVASSAYAWSCGSQTRYSDRETASCAYY